MEIDTGPLTRFVSGVNKDVAGRIAREWFKASQARLYQAAAGRADANLSGDARRDQRGPLKGRLFNNLHHIAQSAHPPVWDNNRRAWVFTYRHTAAIYHEYGTRPHEIRARHKSTLAFKWPDAPDDVVAMFTPGDGVNRAAWDGWVYFKKVDHPGNPAIGFIRHGRAFAQQWMRREMWEEYEGPRGGTGWQHPISGRRYQDRRPFSGYDPSAAGGWA